MRTRDAIRLALGDLWRHKLRTALTVLGVAIGAAILVISLSTGRGVSRAVEEHFRLGGRLRRILVHPNHGRREDAIPPEVLAIPGEMSEARRERLRKSLVSRWSEGSREFVAPLDSHRLAEFAALPHVERVVPHVRIWGHGIYGEHVDRTHGVSASHLDEGLTDRVIAGRLFADDGARSVLVHESLVYRWGFKNERDVPSVVGTRLRLELGRTADALAGAIGYSSGGRVEFSTAEVRTLEEALERLPAALAEVDLPAGHREILEKAFRRRPAPEAEPSLPVISEEFTVAGVFRDATDEERRDVMRFDLVSDWRDLILPVETARRLHELVPGAAEVGYESAMVYVDDERHLKETIERIEAFDHHTSSLVDVVEHIQKYTALVTGGMALLAGIALLVAALGITNTMVMSVLERTRQIGLLKAVGFRDRHVLLLLLVESGLIGLAGGASGVLATWLGSYPGESIARAILAGETGREIEGSLFVFPLWLLAGVPAFTTLMTMLAGLYPARRAARLDPLVALRHE